MLSVLPADLILRSEAEAVAFSAAVSSQLANARCWHINSKQYVKNGWSAVSRVVARSPIQELQIADNDYPAILKEIAPIQLPNLLSLSLIANQILSLEAFAALQVPLLQSLHLSHNCIRAVAPLRKARLPRLALLILNDNPITDCEALAQCHFPRLEFVVLENWSESNTVCADANCLLKLQAQGLRFLGMRSGGRIRRSGAEGQLVRRYAGLEVNLAGD